MEVVGEVYIHEIEVLHDSCRECSKILPRACGSMHVSDHVTELAVRHGYRAHCTTLMQDKTREETGGRAISAYA
jgi:hypothetical protein